MKNILVVSEDFYPPLGGTITYTHHLCNELVKCGYCVTLLTPHSSEYDKEYDKQFQYTIERFGKYIANSTLRRIYTSIFISRHLNQYLKKYKTDLIHVSAGQYIIFGLTLSPSISPPVIWTIHNVAPAEVQPLQLLTNSSLNIMINRIYRYVLKLVDQFIIRYGHYNQLISVSEATYIKLVNAGVDPQITSIIPNGVPAPRLRIQEINKLDKFTILVVGRVIPHKGQYQMLLALSQIINIIPNTHCIFVGPISEGSYSQKIQAYVRENFTDEVTFAGAISDDELESFYDICDVYVQPSYQEGFSITIMEAMIRGKPVIGTNTGAIAMLVDDERGILIQSPEPKLISDAVIYMYLHPDFRMSCAKRGQKYIIDNYEWKNIIKKIINIYDEVLQVKI